MSVIKIIYRSALELIHIPQELNSYSLKLLSASFSNQKLKIMRFYDLVNLHSICQGNSNPIFLHRSFPPVAPHFRPPTVFKPIKAFQKSNTSEKVRVEKKSFLKRKQSRDWKSLKIIFKTISDRSRPNSHFSRELKDLIIVSVGDVISSETFNTQNFCLFAFHSCFDVACLLTKLELPRMQNR